MVSINVVNLAFLIGIAMVAAVAALFFSRLRMLRSLKPATTYELPGRERYRPMLRLLQEEEFALVRGNRVILRRMQQQRRQLFRGYLRCLTADYGRMLAGIRQIMAQSQIDRPDLAHALLRYQTLFALGLCRIELHLLLFSLGLSHVDVTGLLRSVDALRSTQAGLFSPAPAAA